MILTTLRCTSSPDLRPFKLTGWHYSAPRFSSSQTPGTLRMLQKTIRTASISTRITQSSSARKTSGRTCSKTSFWQVDAQCSRACKRACRRKFKHWRHLTFSRLWTPLPTESTVRGSVELFCPPCSALNPCGSRSLNMTRKVHHVSCIANASELLRRI